MRILKWILAVLLIAFVGAFAYYQLYFLRLPDRNIPNDTSLFVSPADGVIASVTHWTADSLIITKGSWGAIKVMAEDVGESGTLVAVTLNLANVHYQRVPIKGTYVKSIYKKGKFNNALKHDNEYGLRFENEHNVMSFTTAKGTPYKVISLAGFAARRIVDYLNEHPGKAVEQGEILGLLKMGSQVAILFPENVEVLVKKGDIVVDGETPMGREK